MRNPSANPHPWSAGLAAVAVLTGSLLASGPAAAVGLTVAFTSLVSDATTLANENSRLGALGNQSTEPPHVINIAACESYVAAGAKALLHLRASVSNDSGSLLPESFHWAIGLAPPGGDCGNDTYGLDKAKETGCVKLGEGDDSTGIGAVELPEAATIVLALLGGLTCGSNEDSSAKFSAFVSAKQGGTATPARDDLTITLALKRPATPTAVAVTPGDKNLTVSWKLASDSLGARVYWSTEAFGTASLADVDSDDVAAGKVEFKISESLTNGAEYHIRVASIDANGNNSDPSEEVLGKPINTVDLWENYKTSGGVANTPCSDAGGADSGSPSCEDLGAYGCSAAPGRPGGGAGGAAMLLLAALIAVSWRRSRTDPSPAMAPAGQNATRRSGRWLIGLGVGLLFLATAPRPAVASSPLTSALDLRFGWYLPGIDREFEKTTLATPYAEQLKESALAWSVAVDWILIGGYGDLSLGGSVGWWSQEGKSLTESRDLSADKTSFEVLPLTMDLVYRFNLPMQKWNVALVPYLKGGFAYAFWWMRDGVGDVSTHTDDNGVTTRGEGGVAGLHGTVGMRLLLDVFEPKSAKSFDIELGVNHSYLFVEYEVLSLNNFGNARTLDLSDEVVTFGLGFDI